MPLFFVLAHDHVKITRAESPAGKKITVYRYNKNGNSTYSSIDQFLRFFVFSTTFATRTHRPTARRYSAKQNSEQCEKKSTSDQTGSNQFEFQSPKTFVSKANKCDHQADADHAKAHVEDDVGAAGRLIRTVVISIEL